MTFVRILVGSCVTAILMTAVGAEPWTETEKTWLSKAGYGLMVHFGVFNVDKWPIEKYDELFEKFDIERFVDQVAETGASYVIWTLGRKWGQGGPPRFDGPTLLQYIDTINAKGGSLTLDVPVSREGEIPSPFLSILAELGKHREMLVNGRVDDVLQQPVGTPKP